MGSTVQPVITIDPITTTTTTTSTTATTATTSDPITTTTTTTSTTATTAATSECLLLPNSCSLSCPSSTWDRPPTPRPSVRTQAVSHTSQTKVWRLSVPTFSTQTGRP